MFKTNRARWALLIDLHEELIRKMDEQIRVEREFVQKLESFMMFEQKMDEKRLTFDILDKAGKTPTDPDLRY